jgi:hypothetical protein
MDIEEAKIIALLIIVPGAALMGALSQTKKAQIIWDSTVMGISDIFDQLFKFIKKNIIDNKYISEALAYAILAFIVWVIVCAFIN